MNNNDDFHLHEYDSYEFIRKAEEEENIKYISRKRKKFDHIYVKHKKKDEIMREKLLEKLDTPIEENTKGFKMLKKMGYQLGKGLGRNEKGIIEPISIKQNLNKTPKIQFNSHLEKNNYNTSCNYNRYSLAKTLNFREKILAVLSTIYNIKDIKKDSTHVKTDWNGCLEFSIFFYLESELMCSIFRLVEIDIKLSDNLCIHLDDLTKMMNLLDKNVLIQLASGNKSIFVKQILYIEKFFKHILIELKKISLIQFNYCSNCMIFLYDDCNDQANLHEDCNTDEELDGFSLD